MARQNYRAPASREPGCTLYRAADAIGRVLRPEDDRWAYHGISVESSGCDGSFVWVKCAGCEKPISDAELCAGPVDPFVVGDSICCGTLAPSQTDQLQADLNERFAATKYHGIDRMFWCGPAAQPECPTAPDFWTGQYLMDPDCEDLTPGGPVDPVTALGLLIQQIADSGQAGMVHVSAMTFVKLLEAQVIQQSVDGLWRTGCDTIIVPGTGYDPCCGPDGEAPPDGAQWMAATGLVTILEADPFPVQVARETSTNETRLVIEQPFLVYHSGCVCARVLVALNCAC